MFFSPFEGGKGDLCYFFNHTPHPPSRGEAYGFGPPKG